MANFGERLSSALSASQEFKDEFDKDQSRSMRLLQLFCENDQFGPERRITVKNPPAWDIAERTL